MILDDPLELQQHEEEKVSTIAAKKIILTKPIKDYEEVEGKTT